jgi:hypothetical protein
VAPYTPLDLEGLRNAVANDLRDKDFKTFSKDQVDDLIREGMAELDRLRPIEQIEALDPTSWPVLPTTLQQVFLVEGAGPSGTLTPGWKPYAESARGPAGSSDGWDVFGGAIVFPAGSLPPVVGTQVRAWGYGGRDQPWDPTDVPEFLDATDEEAVRCYARWQGFEGLLHDRALYQQWQTQTSVSDVSTTQLLQTASSFSQEWSNLRKRLTRLRRVA